MSAVYKLCTSSAIAAAYLEIRRPSAVVACCDCRGGAG